MRLNCLSFRTTVCKPDRRKGAYEWGERAAHLLPQRSGRRDEQLVVLFLGVRLGCLPQEEHAIHRAGCLACQGGGRRAVRRAAFSSLPGGCDDGLAAALPSGAAEEVHLAQALPTPLRI